MWFAATAGPPRDFSNVSYADFQRHYGREPSALLGGLNREALFEENKKKVLAQNVKYAAGESTWWAAINEYADWTDTEFASQKTSRSPILGNLKASGRALVEERANNPAAFDWRTRSPSITTPVKNQASCGSCWAFASTAVLESHYALYAKSKGLLVLAPQTLVNCAPNNLHCGGTGGCEGSIPELAFNYTIAHGIALESDLPYKAHDEPCDESVPKTVTATSYVKLPENSGAALEIAISTVGPVAVNVAANWAIYGGGIFSGGCDTTACTLNHVVVAEGYSQPGATDPEGYWTIRNSWGEGWGEKGYIRLSRKFDNTTFVDTSPASGVACMPFPRTQIVGGESGLLFDMSYPTGMKDA